MPGQKILIVEDEAPIAMDLEELLRELGYTVIGPLVSGEEALRSVAQELPDMILMDIRLQGTLDGIETAERILARYDLPVIYLTANADEATLQRAKFTEPEGYLLKPFRPAEVRATLEAALFKREMDNQLNQYVNALQESEMRFRQLAENIHEMFWLVSADERQVLYVSPAYEKIWGRSCASLYENPASFLDGIHPEDREKLRTLRPQSPTEPYQGEYRVVQPNGTVCWVITHVFPILNKDGALVRIAGVTEDITQRKEAEQLREDLTHALVHDLRNPLARIQSACELIQDEGLEQLTPIQVEMLGMIDKGARATTSLINAILDISQLDSGKMPLAREAIPLEVLFEELENLHLPIALTNQLQLEVGYSPHLPSFSADLNLLRRTLENLLGNALKFTPPNGCIRLQAQLTQSIPPEIVLSIYNSGPGLPPELLGRLFQKFSSGKHVNRGSGLGLAFCKSVVNAHGGRIWAESQPEQGCTFYIALPLSTSP